MAGREIAGRGDDHGKLESMWRQSTCLLKVLKNNEAPMLTNHPPQNPRVRACLCVPLNTEGESVALILFHGCGSQVVDAD